MIKLIRISDSELEILLVRFEEKMAWVRNLNIPIILNSYGYFLRLALNFVKKQDFDYLLLRLKNNKDLEQNEGGYSLEYLANNNPKQVLEEVIIYLRDNLFKIDRIRKLILDHNSIVNADQNDCEYLENNGIKRVYTLKEIKSKIKTGELNENNKLYFYTFNGLKDFNFLYNLSCDVFLILYEAEVNLYEKQFYTYISVLEKEISSENRYRLCGINYVPVNRAPILVNSTLESIIRRLDERSQTAYDGYLNESDLLLDELEDKIQYELRFANGKSVLLDSNDSVFDDKGNLIKTRLLHVGDVIRIYPKGELAENLLQTAIDCEPDIYGNVLEHANFWLDILRRLDQKYKDRKILYRELKKRGLKVQFNTVDTYFKGYRQYPMFNSDLRAILTLGGQEDRFEQIKKSKRLYVSTTIALGRGIKQELKQFLQERTLGDILIKRNFSIETLARFIEEKMPLSIITEIKERIYEC